MNQLFESLEYRNILETVILFNRDLDVYNLLRILCRNSRSIVISFPKRVALRHRIGCFEVVNSKKDGKCIRRSYTSTRIFEINNYKEGKKHGNCYSYTYSYYDTNLIKKLRIWEDGKKVLSIKFSDAGEMERSSQYSAAEEKKILSLRLIRNYESKYWVEKDYHNGMPEINSKIKMIIPCLPTDHSVLFFETEDGQDILNEIKFVMQEIK
jgi:hypothetical protein